MKWTIEVRLLRCMDARHLLLSIAITSMIGSRIVEMAGIPVFCQGNCGIFLVFFRFFLVFLFFFLGFSRYFLVFFFVVFYGISRFFLQFFFGFLRHFLVFSLLLSSKFPVFLRRF